MLETIGHLAAKVYQNKDWHKLSTDERNLVIKLEEAGYTEKKKIPDGFVGKSISSDSIPSKLIKRWPFPEERPFQVKDPDKKSI